MPWEKLLTEMDWWSTSVTTVAKSSTTWFWIPRLPVWMRKTLTVSHRSDINTVAEIADRFAEVTPQIPVVNTVNDNPLFKKIEELIKEVAELKTNMHRKNSRQHHEIAVRSLCAFTTANLVQLLATLVNCVRTVLLQRHRKTHWGDGSLKDSCRRRSARSNQQTDYNCSRWTHLWRSDNGLESRMRRPFSWNFIVADVSRPILGTCFLKSHALVLDLASRRLIHTTSELS